MKTFAARFLARFSMEGRRLVAVIARRRRAQLLVALVTGVILGAGLMATSLAVSVDDHPVGGPDRGHAVSFLPHLDHQ